MQKLLKDYLDELNKKQKRRRKSAIALTLVAVMLISTVAWNLAEYGVAMTGDPKCGLEEHQHSEACYEDVLICGQEESAGHTHTDACRKTEQQLVCGQEESAGHTHTDACFQTEQQLVCGQEESAEHTHTEACYTTVQTQICGQEESAGHTHSESCYTTVETYTCEQEESAGHTHTEACYEKQLVCGKEEHTHSDACFIDPKADVEDASVWNTQYANIQWKDAWGEDLVTAAEKQIGYKESVDNYTVTENEDHKGYTRYGQFVGDVYADWDAAFVNFCMYYAGLEATNLFPKETETAKWYDKFAQGVNRDYLTAPAEYEPQVGDLVFFQRENEETENQMGIVSSYNKETNEIQVIEGNVDNAVKENKYAASDVHITAYLKISELEAAYKNLDAETEETDETDRIIFEQEEEATEKKVTTYTEKVGDVEVIVEAQEGTFDRSADQVYMTVDVLTTEQTEKVEEILFTQAEEKEQTVEDYVIYDINFWADEEHTEKLQPQIPVTLNFKNLNLIKNDSDVVTPICVDETDGTLTEMEGNASETEASMTVEHFTLYGVQVTTGKGPGQELLANTGVTAQSSETGKDWLSNYLQRQGVWGQDANAWQILSQRYDKGTTMTEDGLFRIQKNVIPTNVENEFYIYLNMEPVLSWEEVFLQSEIWIINSANETEMDLSDLKPGMTAVEVKKQLNIPGGGNISNLVGSKDTPSSTQGSNHRKHVKQINLTNANGTVVKNIPVDMHYYLSQGSEGSFTILYRKPNETTFSKVLIRREIVNNGEEILYIPATAWGSNESGEGDYKLLTGRVEPTTNGVTDPMGPYIEYLGSASANNGTTPSDNTLSNNTLTWNGFKTLDRSSNPEDFEFVNGNYYRKYAYQLAYKVRLKVEEKDFYSCAEWLEAEKNGSSNNLDPEKINDMTYPTNGTTTVEYYKTADPQKTSLSADFQIPEVRGLLYDIEFQKVGENGNPLKGAEFSLTGSYYGKEIKEEATSGEDGFVKFRNLPWGKYTLNETKAPEGYVISGGTKEIEVTVCYTTNPDDLEQDHNSAHNADQENDGRNMLYKSSLIGTDGKIINRTEGTPADPDEYDDVPHNKYIDYLGDGKENGQTGLSGLEYYRLYLDVKGIPNVEPEPADIVLILDYSSSMTEGFGTSKRWNYVKESARLAVNTLLPDNGLPDEKKNRVGIVWFDRRANEGNVPFTSEKTKLLGNINVKNPHSGTNYQAAFWNAQDMLKNNSSDRKKFVIFVTDGRPYDYYTNGKENQNDAYLKRSDDSGAEKAAVEAVKEFDDLSGFYAVSVGSEDGTAFLQNQIIGNVPATIKTVIGANKTENLRNAFSMILGSITKQIGNVTITDKLSPYVNFVDEAGEVLGEYDKDRDGIISGTKGDTLASNLGLKVNFYDYDDSYNNHSKIVEAPEYTDNYTYNIDLNDKVISVNFGADYFLERDKVYTISFNVALTDKAFEDSMSDTGDLNTDYPGNITSSGIRGFYSNNEATLSYERVKNGEIKKETVTDYEKPVVQPYEKGEWKIKKVNEGSTRNLPDAVFTLSKDREVVYTGTSGGDGIVNWSDKNNNPLTSSNDIEKGTYILKETVAPVGYVLSVKEWTVEIQAKGAKPIVKDSDDTEVSLDQENNVYILKIENEVLYSLPSTGGSGIYWYIFSGVLLMAAAMLIIYKNKCKEVLKS